jgi:hypothetical protein
MLISIKNIELLKNHVARDSQAFRRYCPQETPLAHAQVIHSLCHNQRQSALYGLSTGEEVSVWRALTIGIGRFSPLPPWSGQTSDSPLAWLAVEIIWFNLV